MDLFAHPVFLQFGVPLIAVTMSIFIKFVTRNDAHLSFRKEDLGVGFDLAATATLLFITASANIAQALQKDPENQALAAKASSIPWMIAAYLVSIWAMSTIVRKMGWEGQDQLKVGLGIILPGLYGLVLLFFTVNWILQ